MMVIFPKAKINIGLRIIDKRTDGYHDIETLFYPIGLCDALEFVVSGGEAGKDTFTETGLCTGCDGKDNLVLRSVRKLREKYFFPYLKIHLHKKIPVGAGLGGGSSDAAFILKNITRCYELNITADNLKAIALEIGSDCPFFIDAIPAFGTGRGEILIPYKNNLSGYYIVLLNPGININTTEAYRNCNLNSSSESLPELLKEPVAEWKNIINNDFEDYAFRKHPLIRSIKDDLYNCGAIFSSMSGSGSSVFGIFSKKPLISERISEYMIYEGLM